MIAWNGAGESNVNSRLTNRDVRWLRKNPDGFTLEQRAAFLGITVGHAREIAAGRARTARPRKRNPNAKLTPAKVRKIRDEYESGGITQKRLAGLYGVSHQTISEIVNYKTWKQTKEAISETSI